MVLLIPLAVLGIVNVAFASILIFQTATSLFASAAQEFGGGFWDFYLLISPAIISISVDLLALSRCV